MAAATPSKFIQWLSFKLRMFTDISDCALSMWQHFDIDNAIGIQLDIPGEILGVSRTVSFNPTDGSSPILDDDTYRILLKSRVAMNSWDGKQRSLQPIWKALFPGGTIKIGDSQDMTAVVSLAGTFTSTIRDLINNGYIVPKPQGVHYTYGFGDLPYFGADRDDAFVSGADIGHAI